MVAFRVWTYWNKRGKLMRHVVMATVAKTVAEKATKRPLEPSSSSNF
jgi:hypothetical protein